jgi:hypothetical protein
MGNTVDATGVYTEALAASPDNFVPGSAMDSLAHIAGRIENAKPGFRYSARSVCPPRLGAVTSVGRPWASHVKPLGQLIRNLGPSRALRFPAPPAKVHDRTPSAIASLEN